MNLCKVRFGLIPKLCLSWKLDNLMNRLPKPVNFQLLYLVAQNSEFSSAYCVWNLVWNSYCFINFGGWFTFCEFFWISKHCWKTKTGSILSSWNCNFELKFECFLVGILKKCLLGSFITPNLVSNGIKFFIFGRIKLKIWFSKFCRAIWKFPIS